LFAVPAKAATVEAAEPVPERMSPGTTSVRPVVAGIDSLMLSFGAVVPPSSIVSTMAAVSEL